MPHEKVTTAQRLEISRRATQRTMTANLLMAGILARLWPSYTCDLDPRYPNPDFPALLCIGSPAGRLVWRLSPDERLLFTRLPHRTWKDEKAVDRIPVLQALAELGW